MPTLTKLCEYCREIPFNTEDLYHSETTEWNLGTAGRIRESDCPFCRLASVALCRASSVTTTAAPKGNCQVHLRWWRATGLLDLGSFQLFHDHESSITEIYICFVADMSTDCNLYPDSVVSLVPGRRELVDFDRVKNWVGTCISMHGDDCNETVRSGNPTVNSIGDSYPGITMLRLIDVHQECIIETTTTCRYVALSYLWGHAANLRLSTVNYSELVGKPKALDRWSQFVPRTIQDAILFVRAIGERFLWCDSLCLVQNNPEDVGRGIQVMDLIYENALVTIVAASGYDANAGLPGVSPGTRLTVKESVEVVAGVELGYHIGLAHRLRCLPYSSRAWTYDPFLPPILFL